MIQYPKGQKQLSRATRSQTMQTNYSSRGMGLENILNQTNELYRLQKRAVIHKKPTPIQVVKVNYPARSAAQITEAYFRQASTTDYNGVYKGRYIDFEAKETKNKTSFPLKNIHEHQLEHMKECSEQGGIAFVIFYFSSLKEYYLLEYKWIEQFVHDSSTKRQSIPLTYIKEHGQLISISLQMTLIT
mgnify:FL=1